MNLKLLLIIFFCFSVSSFAQKADLEVKVFSQNKDPDKSDKSVALVIKRKIDADFDVKQRIDIWLYLSRCPKVKNCATIGDEYSAVSSVKGKKLAKTETLARKITLGAFYWRVSMSSIDVLGYRAPNFSEVPKENKYFYAIIRMCKKPETKKAKAVCTQYTSNEIVLNFNK